MVASATNTQTDTPKSPKARKPPPYNPKVTVPLLIRLKARNLYLNQGCEYKEIAKACGMGERATKNLICKSGWPALKRDKIARMEAKADARMRAAEPELIEAIASESEEIALSALGKARNALERDDEFAARDFQSITGGARNLVQIAKLVRDPGSGAGNPGGSGVTLNVFLARCGPTAGDTPNGVEAAKAVEPVTEVSGALISEAEIGRAGPTQSQ